MNPILPGMQRVGCNAGMRFALPAHPSLAEEMSSPEGDSPTRERGAAGFVWGAALLTAVLAQTTGVAAFLTNIRS